MTGTTGGKVAMLVAIQGLAYPLRHRFWTTHPPAVIYALDECICWPYGDPSRATTAIGKQRYCWAVWKPGHAGGPTTFQWLSTRPFKSGGPLAHLRALVTPQSRRAGLATSPSSNAQPNYYVNPSPTRFTQDLAHHAASSSSLAMRQSRPRTSRPYSDRAAHALGTCPLSQVGQYAAGCMGHISVAPSWIECGRAVYCGSFSVSRNHSENTLPQRITYLDQ